MTSSLDEYKAFIDGLVQIRQSVEAQWMRVGAWPRTPENKKYTDLISQLTSEQQDIIAELLQIARDNGIHDTLARLDEEMILDGLQMVRHGVELAVEPYGTELHWDWWCRCNGDPWPEHQLKEEYK